MTPAAAHRSFGTDADTDINAYKANQYIPDCLKIS